MAPAIKQELKHLAKQSSRSAVTNVIDQGYKHGLLSQMDLTPTIADDHPTPTIPLPKSHVPRTQSELQLYEDMALAERRDLNMFYRLVNGIQERQRSQQQDQHLQHTMRHPIAPSNEPDHSIASIINTRNAHIDVPMYSSSLDDSFVETPQDSSHYQPIKSAPTEWQHHPGLYGTQSPMMKVPIPNQPMGYAMAVPVSEEAVSGWSVTGFDVPAGIEPFGTATPGGVGVGDDSTFLGIATEEGVFTLDL